MRPLSAPFLVVLAVALWPNGAEAAPGDVFELDLVRAPNGALTHASGPKRFTLAGLHWQGPGRVVFRTRSPDGSWSAWRSAAPEDEDRPDDGSGELRRRAGWNLGNPWWVGVSDRIEARTTGTVSRIRAHLVWSPELRVPIRAPAATQQPVVVPRLSWGANESIRRGAPSYAPAIRFAIVHHTAGRSSYTRSEAPAIVRGIQLYHVQSNGWNDIGYNFLVDRFGTIYEGRYGGIDRDVVGAHAQGFNTGSVGIAILGMYGGSPPTPAARDAVARLIAWRLDLAHVDPTGLLTFVSGGSERFANGVPVPLRAVSGHRDTGATQCPGNALYAQLGTIAAEARRIGLPKVFDPRVAENDAGFRFTARLSGSLPWSVVVRSPSGAEVARGASTGSAVDWTWDPASAVAATYTWTIAAGAARPATGSLQAGGSVTLAVEEATAEPAGISPNGDGQADSATVAYTLTAPANVTVEIVDAAATPVAIVVDRVWTPAGAHKVAVDASTLPDGRYDVVITARRADGAEATTSTPLVVSRTLGTVALVPAVFSPNGDGRKDRVMLTLTLAAASDVRVRVLRDGRGVASLLAASLPPGRQRIVWSGLRASGAIRDGTYSVIVESRDAVGKVQLALPLVSDTRAPRVRILSGPRLRVEVSEPAVLRLRVNGRALRHEVERAGVARIPWSGPVGRVRVVAIDAAGNASAPTVRPAGNARPPGQ